MDLATALFWITLRVVDVQRPRIAETVVVAGFTPSLATPTAVTTLEREALAVLPAVTVDDALRSVPGFSLFRRSSSRLANPTTQGATLRGLAASGSSRALVLADDVPLNDPVGGWVYWNRVPFAALDEVSVARGAAGDLHGADAIAGVVSLRTAMHGGRLVVDGGSHRTARGSGYLGRSADAHWMFGAAEAFNTNGAVIVAPESRGTIDTPATSRHGSVHGAYGWMGRPLVMLRGSHFGEERENGTPFQRNGTRATQASASLARWHVASGWSARAYALAQDYEQTFSAVLAGRSAERPTSEQDVGATTFGGSGEWTSARPAGGITVGAAARSVTAALEESVIESGGERLPPSLTEPRQATFAVTARGAFHAGRFSAGGGVRAELWQSVKDTANEHVFLNPRFWLTYRADRRTTVNVALQSGYRGPTINELYRPFRVGNVVTQANAALEPERARGMEAGVSHHQPWVTMRMLAYWSRVDDAIANVTLSSSGGTIVRERRNAARIRARGVEGELEARISSAVVLTASTAYTDSVFTVGPLEGLRVPQVPHWHHAAGVRGTSGRVKWAAEWRYIDEQFDDDRNLFPLARSSMLDARVGWMVKRTVELFGAMENVLDEEQDVGRTPIRTIGLPRTGRVGLRLVF